MKCHCLPSWSCPLKKGHIKCRKCWKLGKGERSWSLQCGRVEAVRADWVQMLCPPHMLQRVNDLTWTMGKLGRWRGGCDKCVSTGAFGSFYN